MTDAEDESNAFSEYGTLAHSILEEWADGFLTAEELPLEYERRYGSVVTSWFPPFPKGYAQKAYDQGLDYFRGFNGFGEGLEIVSAEKKYITKIGQYTFSGIVDLVLKDKEGNFIVYDHKTKSAASMKKEMDLYRRQLYIYARFVYEEFGVFPKTIGFNMIKTNEVIEETFNKEKYDETMAWVEQTIDSILMENEWGTCKSDYFCKFICGLMGHCPEWNFE